MKKLVSALLVAVVGLSSVFVTPALAQGDDKWGIQTDPTATVDPITGKELGANSGLLDTLSNVINWILGFLATIALVLCLYAGFTITTARGDDAKVKKGTGILKNAAIGLVVILLSWAIVRVVFWFVGTMQGTGS